jgi:hypothetical protein
MRASTIIGALLPGTPLRVNWTPVGYSDLALNSRLARGDMVLPIPRDIDW